MNPPGNAISRPLAFAHIGDLHITNEKERNFLDFLSIVAQIESECASLLDFIVLPGDNADNGILGTQLGPNRNAKPFV